VRALKGEGGWEKPCSQACLKEWAKRLSQERTGGPAKGPTCAAKNRDGESRKLVKKSGSPRREEKGEISKGPAIKSPIRGLHGKWEFE